MNLLPRLLTGVALLAALPAAMAASTVDLTVTGTLVPAACTPTHTSPTVSFGKISTADLIDDKPSRPKQDQYHTLNINCTGKTLFAIRGIDNRASTVGNTWYVSPYGLGLTPAGEKLGAHYLTLQPGLSQIDGNPVFITESTNGGSTWGASSSGAKAIRSHGPILGFVDQSGVTTGPALIENASLGLKSHIILAPKNTLTLTDEVALDGAATIEVVYL